jgi:N-acetylmuramoyl-L-alanine amidase
MKPILYLDAGHGGSDPGAVGAMGTREKDVALGVVMLMGALLADVCEVRFTRKTDVFVTLQKRAELANAGGAAMFVSVHCNSAENRDASGFEVYTTPGKTKSDDLAIELFRSFALAFPTRRKRMDTADGDEDKEANFAVLRLTACPAALFELDFISNEDGELILGNKTMWPKFAEALAQGVRAYLGAAPAVPAPVPPPRGESIESALKVLQDHSNAAAAEVVKLTQRLDEIWKGRNAAIEAFAAAVVKLKGRD